jgi:fimbrial chaperone protein
LTKLKIMTSRQAIAIFAVVALFGSARAALAGQLRVEPVLLELNAPAAAASLTLRGGDDGEVVVQTRVLRWSQVNGKETLEPTSDVVASPPSVKLAPGGDYVVRVVRVTKRPVQAEESYRVLVDQLPDLRTQRTRSVNLLLRQSIPVFYRSRQITPSNVTWTLGYENDRLVVAASNAGDERLRIASLRLRDAANTSISFGDGLVGYVLGQSSMSWTAPNSPRGFGAGGTVSIDAETDKGPLHASVQWRGRP